MVNECVEEPFLIGSEKKRLLHIKVNTDASEKLQRPGLGRNKARARRVELASVSTKSSQKMKVGSRFGSDLSTLL